MSEIIIVNGKEIEIKKLPLKKYADLMGAFEELPKHLDLVQGKSQDEILASLPKLISVCYPDVVRVVCVATDLTEEEVDEMGLDDFVKVVDAALRVNNYSEIYKSIKKMLAHPQVEQANQVEIGSGGQ